MKAKRFVCGGMVLLFAALMIGLSNAGNRLTYIEYTDLGQQADTYLTMDTKGQELVQEFQMPYDIIHGISIRVGTFNRDNNSEWDVSILEPKSGKLICQKHFNASLIVDNSFHYIEFDKNARLEKGSLYAIRISANLVDEETALAFYVSDEDVSNGPALFMDSRKNPGTLCIRVYGGDFDFWWSGFCVLLAAYATFIIFRAYFVMKKGLRALDDAIVQGMLLGIVVFLLLCTFAVSGVQFTDEMDNMHGGMIIAKGGVLYRDYVTQHTPVTYYLCALFAMLGAGSQAQFRLSYYIFESLVWILLYLRHYSYFGKKKMIILPILECVFISSLIVPYGYQILSDGVQSLCTVVLSLEFIRYYKDRQLNWSRSLIVSACVWGSFGAAFISAYALLWFIIVVLVIEIKDWINKGFSWAKVWKRYRKLLLAVSLPPIFAVIYFKLNHSLQRAFEQFYLFNREVYPKYTGGLGNNLSQPFIMAFQGFLNIIVENINAIITAKASGTIILQLVIMISATMIVLHLAAKKKRITEAFVLFMAMCCSAVRGADSFHTLPAWYMAIMLIALFYEQMIEYIPRIGIPVVGVLAIYMLSPYVGMVGNNLLCNQPSVSELESTIVAMTAEKEEIFLDAWSRDTLYFSYKDRYLANRAVYMLPWYMDWYERDAIEDLMSKQPDVVVYYIDQETWGHTYYANSFVKKLRENYSQMSDDPNSGWKYGVWIKNNE